MKWMPWITAGLIFLGFAEPVAGAEFPNPLDNLIASYPTALLRYDEHNLYWRDGTVMPLGDRAPEKRFDQLLRNASILDQFHQAYPRVRRVCHLRPTSILAAFETRLSLKSYTETVEMMVYTTNSSRLCGCLTVGIEL